MRLFQVDISNLEMILCGVGQVKKSVVRITATIISKWSYGEVLPLSLNREGMEDTLDLLGSNHKSQHTGWGEILGPHETVYKGLCIYVNIH